MNQLQQLQNLARAISEAAGTTISPELARMAGDLAVGGLRQSQTHLNQGLTQGQAATMRLFMDQCLLLLVHRQGGKVDIPVEEINEVPTGKILTVVPPEKEDRRPVLRLVVRNK